MRFTILPFIPAHIFSPFFFAELWENMLLLSKRFLSSFLCIIFLPFSILCGSALYVQAFPASRTSLPLEKEKKDSSRVAKKQTVILSSHEKRLSIDEKTERFTVHVEYPSTGFFQMDASIAKWARQQVNFFTAGLSRIPADDPTHFTFTVTYERFQPSLCANSFIFLTTTETDSSKAEHGMVTLTYLTQEGRRIALNDLFKNQNGLFSFLSTYTRSKLSLRSTDLVDSQTRLSGTSPDPINFSLFALQKDALVIYFAPSQVASSYDGTISVSIPLKSLDQFKPDLTLWGKPSH